MKLESLIFVGGILHFGILLASAMVPQVLDWRTSLQKLDRLSREVIWVHGAFIMLVIIGFGAVSLALPGALSSGIPLARAVCAFIGFFWGARLIIQLFVFDATSHLTSRLLAAGYHGLTAIFTYLAFVYILAAVLPA